MPSEDTQFTRESVPGRAGLPANTKPVAIKPIGVRFYAEDVAALDAMKDRSGFISEAVHNALQTTSATQG